MIKINPQSIIGVWHAGVALDFQTVSSTPIGPNAAGRMQFETQRTEIGERLFQLKYRGNLAFAKDIAEAAAGFLQPHRTKFDIIVPVPASRIRIVQPVPLMARGIGSLVGAMVADCVGATRATPELKQVNEPAKREELLEGLYGVDVGYTAGKNILLIDDLFRSGSTMNAVAMALIREGKAASVRALTITRTRSNT